MAGLTTTAIKMGAAYVGLYIASSGQMYWLGWVGQKVLTNLRSELFQHLQNLPMSYHDTHIVGVTVSRVINDVAEINSLLSQGLITLAGDLLVLVGIIFVMLSMDVRLALITFTVLPLMALLTYWFTHRARAVRFARPAPGWQPLLAIWQKISPGCASSRLLPRKAQLAERFNQVNVANRDAYVNAMSLSFVFLPSIEFLGMLATAIVLWFGGRQVIGEQVTLGVLVAFLSYVTRFFQPIQEISRIYTTIQSAMAGGEQVLNLLIRLPAWQTIPMQ